MKKDFLHCGQKEVMKEPNLKACSLFGSSSGEIGIKLGATVLPFTVGLAESDTQNKEEWSKSEKSQESNWKSDGWKSEVGSMQSRMQQM